MEYRFGILAAGPLGLGLVSSPEFSSFSRDADLSVSVGKTPGLAVDFESLIINELAKLQVNRVEDGPLQESCDILLAVGWRKLIRAAHGDQRIFVFHDSVLPDLRGWNPLVTAIELGRTFAGVTLFLADRQPDAGPIVGQKTFPLNQNTSISEALEEATNVLRTLFIEFVDGLKSRSLVPLTQDESKASISPWRDAQDYAIDWTASAENVERLVLSRSWPYLGASCWMSGEKLRVFSARQVLDLPPLAIPAAGKVIRLNAGTPTVACGAGFLEILDMRDPQGKQIHVDSLRTRFI